jgi:hypothetical protein
MLGQINDIGILFTFFCVTDRLLTNLTNLDGIYYLLHFIHNCLIVNLTYEEVYYTLTDFNYIQRSEKNILALQAVFALHFYHVALYWRKFRLDDWLHHILMIGIALPIGWFADSKSLLGFSLFFTTGLPGGIDYALLFLTRNNWIDRGYEKRINAWLNTWIRSPGCISHVTLTLALISLNYKKYTLDWWLGIIAAILTFWNGQYFMRQVVENNVLFINWLKNNVIHDN